MHNISYNVILYYTCIAEEHQLQRDGPAEREVVLPPHVRHPEDRGQGLYGDLTIISPTIISQTLNFKKQL